VSKAKIPVIVVRDYDIPGFVDQDTLFLAVSYSGNTEETLSAYIQARNRNASIICITTGGKLRDLARQDGYTVVEIPFGLVPRAATGYLLLRLLFS
jgi:glucose/mannose-6-phosphate isomerase